MNCSLRTCEKKTIYEKIQEQIRKKFIRSEKARPKPRETCALLFSWAVLLAPPFCRITLRVIRVLLLGTTSGRRRQLTAFPLVCFQLCVYSFREGFEGFHEGFFFFSSYLHGREGDRSWQPPSPTQRKEKTRRQPQSSV